MSDKVFLSLMNRDERIEFTNEQYHMMLEGRVVYLDSWEPQSPSLVALESDSLGGRVVYRVAFRGEMISTKLDGTFMVVHCIGGDIERFLREMRMMKGHYVLFDEVVRQMRRKKRDKSQKKT